MPTRLLSLSLAILFLAGSIFAQLNDGDASFGDAPHSHRRLYGIRRLRMLRPIPQTIEHSPTHEFVDRRRQPTHFSAEDSEQDQVFVPRAVAPPRASRPAVTSAATESAETSAESVPTTYIVQTPTKFGKSLDDARRKRIEARWKRLGINFKTINHPLLNGEGSDLPPHSAHHQYRIRQLNAPKKTEKMVEVERPAIEQPILHVVNPLDQVFTETLHDRSKGPTGDGYGPPVFPGGAAPPPVPSVGLGGAAAGKSRIAGKPLTNKADTGFNQVIDHFENGTPPEAAFIDILEVALGSQKLDSQAKLLGHVDRTIGLDNLQRLQRWANTAGAMDVFKDQVSFLKFAKNFQPPPDLLPTVPPQLEYLFKTSGK
ncbi:hypothetical protein CRE_18354 [Caenorhabditis remanei]|uniref:Uncharacterized protein n=1 Tax=Caenorhabditis remanei TaxID=31234 RepID=E3NSU0_CAERE|nr:hypothetical protein CRE_18354 [Caenorhabditis remanei]